MRTAFFWLCWLAAAVVVVRLFAGFTGPTSFPGVVEATDHPLPVPVSTRVAQVRVVLGQVVQSGEVLAELDDAALRAEIASLRDELAANRGAQDAWLQWQASEVRRRSLDHDVQGDDLRRRVDEAVRSAGRDAAELAGSQAELTAVDDEIRRLEAAGASALGQAQQLADRRIARAALAARIPGLRALITAGEGRTAAARATLERWQAGLNPAQVAGDPGSHVARIAAAVRLLAIAEGNLAHLIVRAPCAGRVVGLFATSGDQVLENTILMTIQETAAVRIDGFVPDAMPRPLTVGGVVEVRSQRPRGPRLRSSIAWVDPGYTIAPAGLMSALERTPTITRRIRIPLPADNGFLPGERVLVRMLRDGQDATP